MKEKTGRREWVKSAAIIFLAILLVLTFFSNTILNRTLPEVVTQYAEYGEIDSKVRVSGTVSALQSYDVTIENSRKVATVDVKTGQEVSTGDVLFTLEPGDSEELETAKSELHSLELQYRRAVINAEDSTLTALLTKIDAAQKELDKAQAAYDAVAMTDEEIDELNELIKTTEKDLKEAQTGVEKSSEAESGEGYSDTLLTAWENAKSERTATGDDLTAAKRIYGAEYDALVVLAKAEIVEDYNKEVNDPTKAFSTLTEDDQNTEYNKLLPYYLKKEAGKLDDTDEMYIAYTQITTAQEAYDKACDAADSAYDAYINSDDSVPAKNYNGKSHSYWVTQVETLEENLENLNEKKTEYEEALKNLETCKENLQTLKDSLSSAQKSSKLTAIDLEELHEQVDAAQAKVDELTEKGTSEDTTICAKVNGTITAISITAGKTAEAGTVLVSIELPDRGYTMTTTVTNDQARLLHEGDTAQVNNFYWGSSTEAELTAIRPDSKSPQTSKQLIFEISGDVAAGDNISFAIGEKNASYDFVVPNSAIRTDTNGSYVLVVTAKSSALGNRYFANRVNVEILAKDDQNSAVNGALNSMDSVITTTSGSVPINDGDQIRLSDEN